MMYTKPTLLIYDPTPFCGGSKIATMHILKEIDDSYRVHILTNDTNTWEKSPYKIHNLYELSFLRNKEQGLMFFAKHLWLSLFVLFFRMRFQASATLGISGPGVDYAIYIANKIFKGRILQFIHGPVANSGSINKAIAEAELIFTLAPYEKDMQDRISSFRVSKPLSSKFPQIISFDNGIPTQDWPTPSENKFDTLNIFWAASLLKWKGLDTFLSAINNFTSNDGIESNICYIKPKDTSLEVSNIPLPRSDIHVFESPNNLDQIRSECNVFISTSVKEPFGLSILEALAAGLCVVIPRDGAYWDKVLLDGIHCVKYDPQNAQDLFRTLKLLSHNMHVTKKIGFNGAILAKKYSAENCYQNVASHIRSLLINNVVFG